MLSNPATFPHAGAPCFVRGTAEPARIIQRNADGTCLVSLEGPRPRSEDASRTCRLPLAELAATAEQAMDLARRPRRRA